MLKSITAAIILALPLTLAAPTEQSNSVASQYTDEVPEVYGDSFIDEAAENNDVTVEFLDDDAEVEESDMQTRATHYGDFTHFTPGLGACGWNNGPNDMVVAVSVSVMKNKKACGKKLRVKGPKGSVDVKIVDLCPSCATDALDLSPAAFKRTIGDLGIGRKQGSWIWL